MEEIYHWEIYAEIRRYSYKMPIFLYFISVEVFKLILVKSGNRGWIKPHVDSMFLPLPKASLNSVLRNGVIKILPTILLTLLLISSVINSSWFKAIEGQCSADFPNWADSKGREIQLGECRSFTLTILIQTISLFPSLSLSFF